MLHWWKLVIKLNSMLFLIFVSQYQRFLNSLLDADTTCCVTGNWWHKRDRVEEGQELYLVCNCAYEAGLLGWGTGPLFPPLLYRLARGSKLAKEAAVTKKEQFYPAGPGTVTERWPVANYNAIIISLALKIDQYPSCSNALSVPETAN